jgi:hypothetical protein
VTAWVYLIVFLLLNVFIWRGMERITRHLARMSGQLDTLVSLITKLTDQLAGDGGRGPRSGPASSEEQSSEPRRG